MNPRVCGDVTVVIPTIGRPVQVERCLRALLLGDALPGEAIVVDQSVRQHPAASRDGLRGAFTERGSALTWIEKKERGVSQARNVGIRLARGTFVAFIDDDCVPEPQWLAGLVDICAGDVAGVSGRVLPLPSAAPHAVAVSSRSSERPAVYRGVAPHAPWDVGTGGNLLLRRRVLEEVGGFDETLGPGAPGRAAEDIELLYRVLGAGHAIAYSPVALVRHEQTTRHRRLRGRLAYASGMGTFLGSYAWSGDRRALTLFFRYLRLQTLKLMRSIGQRRLWPALEACVSIPSALWSFVRCIKSTAGKYEAKAARG